MGYKQLGALQTGTVAPFEFACYGFSGGINVKDVPEMIGDSDLVQAQNGYLRASGGFQMRNGITTRGTADGTGPVDGVARFYQQIRNGAPVVPATTSLLKQVAGTLYDVDTGTNHGSIGGADAQPWTFMRFSDPDDPNTTSGNTDVIVICTGAGGPYVWDGTNLYTPSGWANATNAQWCALVNGIGYFGGIKGAPNIIYGTGDGIVESFETLPGYRVFAQSQPVTGLCAYGSGPTAALVIGQNVGLSVLYGTGPDNYVLQDIPSDDGVVAGRSMVYDNGIVFYLGRQAFYAFNGQSTPIRITDKIEPWLLNDGYVAGFPMTGRANAFGFVYNNRVYLGYTSNDAEANNTLLTFDLVVNGWTVQTPTPGMNAACLLDAPGDPSPATCIVGSSATSQCYTWDVEPAVGAEATDNGTAISSVVQTKFFKIGAPGTNKALTRCYPEFFLPGPLSGVFEVQTDYGQTVTAQVVAQAPQFGSLWDAASWDAATWSNSSGALQPYVAPASRIDFPGTQGEAYAFGFYSNGGSSPWVFGGLTGVIQQRGRT